MTREEQDKNLLASLPVRRTLRVDDKYDLDYWLGKTSQGRYFVDFSKEGNAYPNFYTEESMLSMLRNETESRQAAAEIYYLTPQLRGD